MCVCVCVWLQRFIWTIWTCIWIQLILSLFFFVCVCGWEGGGGVKLHLEFVAWNAPYDYCTIACLCIFLVCLDNVYRSDLFEMLIYIWVLNEMGVVLIIGLCRLYMMNLYDWWVEKFLNWFLPNLGPLSFYWLDFRELGRQRFAQSWQIISRNRCPSHLLYSFLVDCSSCTLLKFWSKSY